MRFAFNGLITLLRTERNFRIMGIVSIVVVVVGYVACLYLVYTLLLFL